MAGNRSGKGLREESSRGVFTPPNGFLLLFSELFLVLFGWATVPPCEPIPGCLKQADCFGRVGSCVGQIGFETGRLLQATFIFLGFRSNLRFAGDASYSPKKSVCCTRTFCSCYVWSSILFLLWVLPGFYSCCVSNKALVVPSF